MAKRTESNSIELENG